MGHLDDVEMTYFEHLLRAFRLSFRFGLSSVQLIIHGIFPMFFTDAGKKAASLYDDFQVE
jgi:hypothetical protein